MKKLRFKYNKIASAMITNINLLKEVAKERKKMEYPIFLPVLAIKEAC